MSEFKIRIFQPIVPEYRVALFDGLAEVYGDRIEICASDKLGSDVSYPLSKMRYDYGHAINKIGPFIWQKGLSLNGLSKGDVVIVCGDVHQLSSLWIALKARLCGIKVVWWGHHVSALARERNVRARLAIARRLSDVYLCYTEVGIPYLEQRGFMHGKVFATGNTIDLDAVEKAKSEWDGIRKCENKKTLLFCGVLRDKVRVDVLLHALKILSTKRHDFHCAIIGNGPKANDWQNLSQKIGVESIVTWVGELRGQDMLAPWFLSADLFVYPGRIGLSIVHAFAYGLPVVLNSNKSNHGPEYELFNPGVNGYAFEENNAKDMANAIEQALSDEDRVRKGCRGQKIVYENYTMKKMCSRFAKAVEAAHGEEE